MNKNTLIIKSCIEELLSLRQKRFDEYIDLKIKEHWALDIMNNGHTPIPDEDKIIWEEFVSDFDFPLLKLNSLLEKDFQNREVLEIEKNMVKLHGKEYLSVKEFEDKYDISKNTQAQYRSRMHDPLPYRQIVLNGKITYVVKDVEQWLQNQHK